MSSCGYSIWVQNSLVWKVSPLGTLNVSSYYYLLVPRVLMRNQLLIFFRIPRVWQVASCQFSIFWQFDHNVYSVWMSEFISAVHRALRCVDLSDWRFWTWNFQNCSGLSRLLLGHPWSALWHGWWDPSSCIHFSSFFSPSVVQLEKFQVFPDSIIWSFLLPTGQLLLQTFL